MCIVIAGSLEVRVGVVNEMGGILFLNRKMSAKVLKGNDCSLWVL